MGRGRWRELQPWKPFFWRSRLPTGIYLKSEREPALHPSGHEVDGELYYAVRLTADLGRGALRFNIYAYRVDPGAHTERSTRREGYWYFGGKGVARSPSESINVLKHLMHLLEMFALDRETVPRPLDMVLNRVVAWEERMTPANHTPYALLKES